MNWYIKVIKKYVTFSGRARRAEYWYFILFNFLIAFAIGFVEGFVGAISGADSSRISIWSSLYNLFVFLPSLAVSVRRLHDTGRSGWWIFINLIPIIGWIIYIIYLCQDSQPEENQYGPNPKNA